MNDRTRERSDLICLLPPILRRIEETPDGCWLWTGAVTKGGYAQVRIRGKAHYVHRLIAAALGHELDGLVLHHRCRGGRRCVKPWHLEPITQSAHMRLHNAIRPRDRKGRWVA